MTVLAPPAGLLELELAPDGDGRTVLARRRSAFPLQLTVPMYLDPLVPGMAFLYVQNPTGGIGRGDDLTLDVRARAEAKALVTTQSATKVYRMEEGGSARQRIALAAEEGSYLEYLPDPLIPQAGSRFAQTVAIRVAPGAVVVYGEVLYPGRLARGERFAYDRLSLRVESPGLFVEAAELRPRERPLDVAGVLDDRPFLASLYVIAPGRQVAAQVAARLEREPGVLAGASELPNGAGALARILGSSSRAVAAALHAAWDEARRALLGAPAPRLRK